LRALLVLLLLAGCRGGGPARGVREVKDGVGRTVKLPAEVRRVISLAPSTTEILFAIGAADLVVGIDRFSDFPPEALAKERVGSNVDPSFERIVALKPDVVFAASTANRQETVDGMGRLGITVYTSRATTLASVLDDIRAIAGVVGKRLEGDELAAKVSARLDSVKRNAAARAKVPALIVVWSEPLSVAGKGSVVAELLELAGGRNIAFDTDVPFPTFPIERVLVRAPEVLVVGTHSEGAPPLTPLLRHTTLPAVKNHRVYLIDGNLLFRPGPRVADGAERLAQLLHGPVDGGLPP
jgi:iron complex transport system substrate-binding protein